MPRHTRGETRISLPSVRDNKKTTFFCQSFNICCYVAKIGLWVSNDVFLNTNLERGQWPHGSAAPFAPSAGQ